MPYVEAEDVARLQTNEKLKILSAPYYLRYAVLFLNNSNPLFQQKEVRQAMAYAINRDRVIADALDGQGVPGSAVLSPPLSWAYNSETRATNTIQRRLRSCWTRRGGGTPMATGSGTKMVWTFSFVILTNDNSRRVKAASWLLRTCARWASSPRLRWLVGPTY